MKKKTRKKFKGEPTVHEKTAAGGTEHMKTRKKKRQQKGVRQM